jgi:hypothetical protein
MMEYRAWWFSLIKRKWMNTGYWHKNRYDAERWASMYKGKKRRRPVAIEKRHNAR